MNLRQIPKEIRPRWNEKERFTNIGLGAWWCSGYMTSDNSRGIDAIMHLYIPLLIISNFTMQHIPLTQMAIYEIAQMHICV